MSRHLTSLSRTLVPLSALVVALPARASSKEAAHAEHTRLAEEMRRLAARNAWRGVDEKYREMLDLQKKGVELTYEDHWLGAQAARDLGDINATYLRLERAMAVKQTDEVKKWIADIDANYGSIDIRFDARYTGSHDLKPDAMPFAPDQRGAIERARRKLSSGQEYKGLLPKGGYTVGSQHFQVKPGQESVSITVGAPAAVASAAEAVGKKGPLLAYAGPRADLGASFTSAGSPYGTGIQAQPFSGAGLRAGLGFEAGINQQLGVLLEVGYHGLYAASPTLPSDAVGRYELWNPVMHLGFGWLAGTYHLSSFTVSAGPEWGMGYARAEGLADSSACNGDSVCIANASWVPVENARMMAAGFEAAVAYPLATVVGMNTGVGLHAGLLGDGARTYPWGQLAFTLSPSTISARK